MHASGSKGGQSSHSVAVQLGKSMASGPTPCPLPHPHASRLPQEPGHLCARHGLLRAGGRAPAAGGYSLEASRGTVGQLAAAPFALGSACSPREQLPPSSVVPYVSAFALPSPLPSPQATVSEALHFSATLRLPSTVDKQTRTDFVEEVGCRKWESSEWRMRCVCWWLGGLGMQRRFLEADAGYKASAPSMHPPLPLHPPRAHPPTPNPPPQVLALTELDRLRDAYIGELGVSGLSVEQRKVRCTLWVAREQVQREQGGGTDAVTDTLAWHACACRSGPLTRCQLCRELAVPRSA